MKGRGFVANASMLTSSALVASALSGGLGLVTARIMGPGLFGTWQAMRLVQQYSGYANMGAPWSMQRDITAALAHDDPRSAQRALDVVFTLTLVATLVFEAVLILLSAVTGWPFPLGWATLLGTFLVVFQTYSLGLMILNAHYRFGLSGAVDVLTSLVNVAATIGLVLVFGLTGLLIAQTLWCLVGIGLIMGMGGVRPRLVVDWTLATHYVRSGLLFTINGFLYLCTRSVDRILILAVLGTTALGWYGLAIFAAGYVELAAQALGRAMYPHMVGEFEADGDHEVMRPYVTQVNLALGLLVPCATGLAALVLPPLVTAILPRYVPGIMAAQILMLSAPFVVVRYTASYYFVATATIERTFKVQMVATVVAAGACAAALAAGMGTGGAALGMALANLVSAVGFLSLALDSFGVTRVRVTAFAGRVLLPSFYVGGSVAVLEAMPVNWVGGVGVGSVLGQSACLLVLCSPLLVAGWRVAAPFLFHSRSTWATA